MFVTIITISYNAASLIERTLQSILQQTAVDYEYVLIDGKSTDKTLDIIHSYESAFRQKGISYHCISEPDKGIYDAMNKGLEQAKGDYVWFVNGGDTIASPYVLETIQQQLSATKKPDFIYGETHIVNDKGVIMGQRRLKAPDYLDWKSFKMGMLVCHQSMLVKRALAPTFNLQYSYSADFDWTIRCLQAAQSIHNSRIVVSHFLDGGVSKKKMKASLKERFNIMSIYYGWLPTALRHLWFVLRAAWFKLLHGWI
jgi:glycosyltransferase involved in cell wall biosynthesis